MFGGMKEVELSSQLLTPNEIKDLIAKLPKTFEKISISGCLSSSEKEFLYLMRFTSLKYILLKELPVENFD